MIIGVECLPIAWLLLLTVDVLLLTGGGALGVLPLNTHGPIGTNLPILYAHGSKLYLPASYQHIDFIRMSGIFR